MSRRIILPADVQRITRAQAKKYEDDSKAASAAAAAGQVPTPPPPEPPREDTYADQVLKLVPAEVVAVYIAVDSAMAAVDPTKYPIPSIVPWLVVLVLMVAAYFYSLRTTQEAGAPPATLQAGLAAASFLVWVFATGGPFEQFPWYAPYYGILLPIYTLFIPLVLPKRP